MEGNSKKIRRVLAITKTHRYFLRYTTPLLLYHLLMKKRKTTLKNKIKRCKLIIFSNQILIHFPKVPPKPTIQTKTNIPQKKKIVINIK